MAKSYTSNVRMETGAGRSFYSWTVLDSLGKRVKFGTAPLKAEAALAAAKAIWRLEQAEAAKKTGPSAKGRLSV